VANSQPFGDDKSLAKYYIVYQGILNKDNVFYPNSYKESKIKNKIKIAREVFFH